MDGGGMVQEDTEMQFDVRPPGIPGAYDATGRVSGPAPSRGASGPGFARLYELEEARRMRAADLQPVPPDRIPDEVWDEVDRAAKLVEQLHGEGKRLMFDNDRLTGRVVASLLDESDGSIAPVSLSDAVDPSAARAVASDGPAEVA